MRVVRAKTVGELLGKPRFQSDVQRSSSSWPRGSSRGAETRSSSRGEALNTTHRGRGMAENRGVAYMGPGKVELQDIDLPPSS
jgi:hypothetical protein